MHFRQTRQPAKLLIGLFACLCFSAHAQAIRMLVQSSPLAGFGHYEAAANFDAMKPGDALTLVREPDNPYDVSAVCIEWHGIELGYLPQTGKSRRRS